MFAICFHPFYENGKSLIWMEDGLQEHYTKLIYLSKLIRTTVRKHKLPMIDFTIGYGADAFVLFGGEFLSPLNWIAAFFEPAQMETVYCFLIVLRFYLVGAAFSCYCFYMKRDYLCTLTGAFVYTFCGYCLFPGVRHPAFLFPAMSLPVFLICIEKLIEGKKNGWMLSLCIAVMGTQSYYFCYMMLVVGVIYGFFRGVSVKKNGHEILNLLMDALLYGGLGIGMAMAKLLPDAYGFLSSTRSGETVYYANNALFYPATYYIKMLMAFASPLSHGSGYWVYISVGAPATVAAVILMLTRQKEFRWLKQVFLILMLMLCIPFAGSVMNGFGYVTNRWVWAVCFFTAYILVCETDRLLDASRRLIAGLLTVLGLTLFLYCVLILKKKPVPELVMSLASVILFLLMILFFTARRAWKTGFRLFVLAFSLGSIVVSANYKYDPERKNFVSQFLPAGTALNSIMSNADTSVKSLHDESFYRVSNNVLGTAVNHGMVADFNTVGHFWSILDDHVYRYLAGMEIPGMTVSFRIYGLDQRSSLESLASVKYYARQEESPEIVPSGYVQIDTRENPYSGEKDLIYENENYLPIGYSYEETVRYEDYENLNPVEKEQLMLRKLVLDDGEALKNMDFLGETVSYSIADSENIKWDTETDVIEISEDGAELSLSYTVPAGDTIYVRLKGFNTDGHPKTAATFTAAANGLTKEFYTGNKQHTYPINRENYTLNFGVSDGTEQKVSITFPYQAEYKLEDIEIYAVPEYRYSEYLTDLRKESLDNVVVSTNLVQGDITVSSPKYLCFSIPYSEGWTAYVDDRQVDTIRANVMYMAVHLEPGNHHIRLEYCTPGLKTGAVISLICTGVLIGLVFFLRRSGENKVSANAGKRGVRNA